ncbi:MULTISPECIES: hypothetical protein [unclassified Mesorhizobium]|nr:MULTISPECIES: hypothetical protein [unclassified Mesorhizobium]
MFTEGAILIRSGTPSRVDEAAQIAPTLRQKFETVIDLLAPGHADDGM